MWRIYPYYIVLLSSYILKKHVKNLPWLNSSVLIFLENMWIVYPYYLVYLLSSHILRKHVNCLPLLFSLFTQFSYFYKTCELFTPTIQFIYSVLLFLENMWIVYPYYTVYLLSSPILRKHVNCLPLLDSLFTQCSFLRTRANCLPLLFSLFTQFSSHTQSLDN